MNELYISKGKDLIDQSIVSVDNLVSKTTTSNDSHSSQDSHGQH